MVYAHVPNLNGEESVCDKNEVTSLPTQVLGEVMKETSECASEARRLVHMINNYMFAERTDENQRDQEPRCFRDELLKARGETATLCSELKQLACMLGIH